MRRIIVFTLIIFMLATTFASCRRYENGPAFSLRSVKTRLAGEWHLSDLQVNDSHDENLYAVEANSILTINKDGSFSYEIKSIRSVASSEGVWSLNDEKNILILTVLDSINGNFNRDYTITRLSNSEMWLVDESIEYSGMDDMIERRFEKNFDTK